MKKIMIYLLPMLLMTLGIVSCQKEEQTFGNGKLRVRLERPQTKDGEKVSFDMSGFQWESGDQIRVIRKRTTVATYYWGYFTIEEASVSDQQGQYAVFSYTPSNNYNTNVANSTGVQGTYYVYYPASICTLSTAATSIAFTYADRIVIPETQTSSDGKMHGFPMYGESKDLNVSFTNLCGILKLHLTGSGESVSAIAITTDASHPIAGTFIKRLNTENKYEIVTGTSSNEIVSNTGRSTVTLTCSPAQDISNGKDFFIYLPTGNYPYMEITLLSSDGKTWMKKFDADQVAEIDAINIARSCYTSVSFNNITFTTEEIAEPYFKVSANTYVQFSPGNLQYDIDAEQYGFAEHDYDYIGADNVTNLSSNSDKIDLFGWGTGDNPTNNSSNTSDYPQAQDAFVEWGNSPWRSLTYNEALYLFNTRNASTINGTSNARYAKAKVNDVYGLIIFPDVYVHPNPTMCPYPTGINATGNAGWNGNDYTEAQWAAMKAAGAVFLPAAGDLSNDTGRPYEQGNSRGAYWTSSRASNDNAYCFYFESSLFNRGFSRSKDSGNSVRLVKNYTPSK